MFGNFIYFLVALLIYTTYQPAEEPNFSPAETLMAFTATFLLFVLFTRLQFARVRKRMERRPWQGDPGIESALTRQSILAVALFALDIYGLSLPWFLSGLPPFSWLPTLRALVFIALFSAYMAVVWACAHPVQRAAGAVDTSRGAYVLSNIAFAVPVLLPWLALSAVSDLIQVLPFQWPRRILDTTAGEIGYFLFFLLLVAVWGPLLIQKFWRCRPLPAGAARTRIEALCRRAGMRYREIMVWPIFGGGMITAGVMGLAARYRYILVTEALLRYLTPEEVDAVIAHEIGHVKRRHLLFYLFFFVGYMVISYAVFDLMILLVLFFEPFYGLLGRTGIDQATLASGIFSLMIIAMFLLYFRFIFGYFMRNFERQADAYVYRLQESARPLISTFEKIATTSGHPPDRPNWHHFSILERILFLRKCESDRRWIRRHDRKIRRSMALFLGALALIAAFGYQLNFGEAGRQLNRQFLRTIVERELAEHPEDARLLATLGDLFYHSGDYRETIRAYEHSLRIDPRNPHVLNNLAWLYATCEERELRRPRRALILAQAAVRLERSPQVLDTLAESYFVNGMVEAALAAEREALKAAAGDRAHYQRQIGRFLRSRDGGETPAGEERTPDAP